MVEPQEIKLVVSLRQLAIRLNKPRVARHCLVQQISCLLQFGLCGAAKTCQKEILGASIETECGEIGGRNTFNRALFSRRELGLQLVCDRLRDFVLDGENVCYIAIKSLRPPVPIGTRIDQLCINAHTIADTLHTSFQNVCYPKLMPDFAEITRDSTFVLRHPRAADHF